MNLFSLKFIFRMLLKGLHILVFGTFLKRKEGARFLTKTETNGLLSPHNKGLLVDGEKGRLTEKQSYQNICVIARVGAGKTSRYIIPNVLDKANKNCSLVVNDPKGEVFASTSGYMQAKGFRVMVINPEDLAHSSRFNPLLETKDAIELEQIAEILIKAGSTAQGKDAFWDNGAIRLVSILLKLLDRAKAEDPAFFTLGNLYYLLQNFGKNGELLTDFVIKYAYDPDHPHDATLWEEWQGIRTGNETAIQSFALTALTSLRCFTNKNMVDITSNSSFKLEQIRDEKTIIYFIIPAQYTEYYSFWTSIFFRSVFNTCMRQMPHKKTLPTYILYDEFGHSTIPNFVSIANTIRGYRVSLSIVLQSISQLEARYGQAYAYSIQGGFNSYLTYSGSDPTTTQFFERISGRVIETQKNKIEEFKEQRNEYNLMPADRVRTLHDDEAVFVSANKYPVILKTTAYFKNWKLKHIPKRFAQAVITSPKKTARTKRVEI